MTDISKTKYPSYGPQYASQELVDAAIDLLRADDWLYAIAQEDEDFLKSIGRLQREQYSAWSWANWSGARNRVRDAINNVRTKAGNEGTEISQEDAHSLLIALARFANCTNDHHPNCICRWCLATVIYNQTAGAERKSHD